MSGRVVWYLPGSAAVSLLTGLPAELEARPVPSDLRETSGPDDSTLVVDLDTDSPERATRVSARLGAAVVALVDARVTEAPPLACHAYLAKPVPPFALVNALRHACEHARLVREREQTLRELEELNAIGVRLTAERDTDALLELILTKARELTGSDAGSIYVVEEPEREPARLRFKLAQNDSTAVAFTEFTLPISDDSIAGHVALTGEVLLLDDVYGLPDGFRFRVNREFDAQAGYRTKSMLVVAMRTPAGQVIGVLQLINRKRHPGRGFASAGAIERDAVPYPPRFRELAASLASQAAVALENSRLYQSIHRLFEGFVQASVTAIESRDPTTSGHSFRVADLTVALAALVNGTQAGPLAPVQFSDDEMRELRYASLLHDFGKVGVREELLVKAKKLHPWHAELIKQRGEIIKRGVELRYAHRKIHHLVASGMERFREASAAWDAELACLLDEVDTQLKMVAVANEPAILPADGGDRLRQLALSRFIDHLGEAQPLITDGEARILAIPQGSLTPDEVKQVQSHVLHTFQFLRQIPWTRELRRIPEIASWHHEKLDGSGYPSGKRADDIPLQTRIMTIADIFDALTAKDRPYKAAVPVARALEILSAEARSGSVDADLLELFIAGRVWEGRTPTVPADH